MRCGVISDVHANLPALEAAFAKLAALDVDEVICAGDLVGYGPHPNECVAAVAERGITCVTGNHDLMALGRLGFDRADWLARTTLEWTREKLGADARAYLEGLPVRVDLDELTLAHGSLDDPTEYVRSDEAAAAQLDQIALPLLVLGHTHTAMAYGTSRGRLLEGRAGSVDLEPGERHLLNAGSVGQARERRPLARLLVVDTSAASARFVVTAYPHKETRAALETAGLPPDAYHRRRTLGDRAAGVKQKLLRR